MKLGFDIDGCLANFNEGYAKCLTKHTGIEFEKPIAPQLWHWERAAGVTKEQEEFVWKNMIMQEGSIFWQNLPTIEGAAETIRKIHWISKHDNEVYFITTRMGDKAKEQTENWLYEYGMDFPTVIITNNKVPFIRALKLNFYIDDKLETIRDINWAASNEKWQDFSLYIQDARYNRVDVELPRRVGSVKEALELEGLWQG